MVARTTVCGARRCCPALSTRPNIKQTVSSLTERRIRSDSSFRLPTGLSAPLARNRQ